MSDVHLYLVYNNGWHDSLAVWLYENVIIWDMGYRWGFCIR